MPAVATDDDVMPSQMASDDLMPSQLAPVSNPDDSTPSVDPLKLAQWQLDLANQVQRLTGLAMAEWAQQPRPQPGASGNPTSQQSLAIDPRSLGAASNFGVPVVNAQPPLNLGDQLRQAQIDRIMALAKTPDQSALAQRYATDLKTPALPTPSPLGVAVVSPFAYAGRMAKGLVEDAAEGWGGQNVYGAPFEDFAAAASSPTDFKTPLPLDQQLAEGQEELRQEGHPLLAAGPDVSLGVAQAAPRIAGVALAPATLPAQMTASGLLFGLDDDGNFSVKDAGLAMLMPGAGAVSRLATGKAIAAGIKAGVPALSNPVVQSVLMKSGDQLAMNATMLAMQSPELVQLWQTDRNKFWQAVGATVGQNLAFALLPHTGKAGQSETAPSAVPPRETSQPAPGAPDGGAAASGPDNEPPADSSETAPASTSPPATPANTTPTPEALADLQSILRGNQGDALLKSATAGTDVDTSSSDTASNQASDSNLSSGPSNRDTTETSDKTPSDGALPTNGGHVSDDGRTPVPSDPTPGYVPEPLPPDTPFNRVRSKVPLPGGGLNAKWLEASLGDLQAGLPGAPELVIVQSVKDLPQRQRGMVETDLKQGYRTSGIFDEGKAWLIADHLGSLDEARTTYLEEALGHSAMEPLVKPGEVDRLYDLIRRGAPQKAAEIQRNYGHDVRTAAGRAAFVGEFVAKASEWYLEAPSLWRRIADVMRRLAYRVKWLRDIAPSQVLDATMRGLARKGIARLAANAELKNGPNRLSQSASQSDDSTGPRFSRVRRPAGPDADNHFATTSNTVTGDADSLRPLAAPKRSGGGSTGNRPQGLSDLASGRMTENGGPAQAGGRVQTPSEPKLAETPTTQQTEQSDQKTKPDAGTTVPPASDFNLSKRGEPGSVDAQLSDDASAPDSTGASAAQPSQNKTSSKSPGWIAGSAAEAWANDVLRGAGTHGGTDVIAAYAVKGAAVLERGLRDATAWTTAMIKECGDAVRPHLALAWARAHEIVDPPVKLTGDEFGTGLSPSALRDTAQAEALRRWKQTTVLNRATGKVITIAASGIKHVKGVSGNLNKVKLLAVLPQILERSRYLGSEANAGGNRNIKQWHYFETHAVVGPELMRVRSAVKEDHQGHLFYDYDLSRVEKELPTSISHATGEPEANGPVAGSSNDQSTGAGETVKPANETPTPTSGPSQPGIADQLADKLEAFKSGIKPGGPQMHIFGLAADLWDRAISMAQAVIRAGGSVGHAIDAAIRHIRENHQGSFDENSVRGFLSNKLGLETPTSGSPTVTGTLPQLAQSQPAAANPVQPHEWGKYNLKQVPAGSDPIQRWQSFPKSETPVAQNELPKTSAELKNWAGDQLSRLPDRVRSPWGKEVILHQTRDVQSRANHYIAGQAGMGPSPTRARILPMLAHTIRNAMAYATISGAKGRAAYLYRYADGSLHVVVVDNAKGTIERQFVNTQYPHDPSLRGNSDLRVLYRHGIEGSGGKPPTRQLPLSSSAESASDKPALPNSNTTETGVKLGPSKASGGQSNLPPENGTTAQASPNLSIGGKQSPPTPARQKIQAAIDNKHQRYAISVRPSGAAHWRPDIVRRSAEAAFNQARRDEPVFLSNAVFNPKFGLTEIGRRLQTMARDYGVEIVFYKGGDLSPDGFYYDGKLFVRSNLPTEDILQTLEHELVHHQSFVDNRRLVELRNLVDITSPEAQQLRAEYDRWLQAQGLKPLTDDRLRDEMTAYFVSADSPYGLDLAKGFVDPIAAVNKALQYHAEKPVMARVAFGRRAFAPGGKSQHPAGSVQVRAGPATGDTATNAAGSRKTI